MSSFWNDVIVPALNGILESVLELLPSVVGALTILIVGWIIAKIISSVVSKLLGKIGLNGIAERAGITEFLKKSGFKQDVPWVVGRLIYWAIMLLFLLSAVEALHLTAMAEMLQKAVAYFPNLIVIVFVLVFGSLLSRLAGKIVTGAAASANIDFAELLGKLASNFILIAIVIIAISQLEFHSEVLDYVFIALLFAIALATAITLGFGSRDVAQGIIYGVYARKIFQAGQQVTVLDQDGELIQIGTINSVIRTQKEIISMPNKALVEGIVRIKVDENK
ncbi:MAG: hypothetical protein DWP97_01055 [Calditrichaeota bacterium]|nr:MAG: hypothetical protein DWP97_01055 [Calditrichota bacterium]